MKIGLVGGSREQRSLPWDAQRTINFMPLIDEQGRDVTALYGTPGLSLFSQGGSGGVRGCILTGGNRAIFVIGSEVREVFADGSQTVLGSMLTSFGNISIAEGFLYIAFCDGQNLYSLKLSDNTFQRVTSASLPSSIGFVTNINSYFVVSENDSGRFYIALNDPTTWDALDFATAENDADELQCPFNAVGQLWLFGTRTIEIWQKTTAASFPFRITGTVMDTGVLAKHSVAEVDNTVIWIGRDDHGAGIVYRANGFTPIKISTNFIERKIKSATNPEDIKSWTYQEEGQIFYVLTGGGLETSLVYDFSTQEWHERAYMNMDGNFEQHLGNCHVYAFGKNLVGSRKDGKIYGMSLDYYDDDGSPLVSERVYTHMFDESQKIRYNSLEIGCEVGIGLQSGQGSDPLISLQLSKDGARTWSNWITKSMGKVGKYTSKVVFRRLGIAEQMTFKIRISDPVKRAITGSYLR